MLKNSRRGSSRRVLKRIVQNKEKRKLNIEEQLTKNKALEDHHKEQKETIESSRKKKLAIMFLKRVQDKKNFEQIALGHEKNKANRKHLQIEARCEDSKHHLKEVSN